MKSILKPERRLLNEALRQSGAPRETLQAVGEVSAPVEGENTSFETGSGETLATGVWALTEVDSTETGAMTR